MVTRDEEILWTTSVLTYGVGDIFTTTIGLRQPGVIEAHPISASILETSGVGGMIAIKALTLIGFGALWRISPEEIRIGVPVGLTMLGSGIVLNNIRIISEAT